MCPLVLELKSSFNVKVCVTAQHRHMLDQVLNLFEITPDYDLNLMKPSQNLSYLTSKIIDETGKILSEEKPNIVLVHGDTTTAMAASLAAFYAQIPVGHVEAGLRTFNINSPFPEELNRQIASKVTKFHFAPTENAKQNLLSEKIPEKNIFVTGNTVIDSLLSLIEKAKFADYPKEVTEKISFLKNTSEEIERFILVTGHRRENFGQGFIEICESLKVIALQNPEINIIYPVHLNPNVLNPVTSILSKIKNIFLIEPVDYLQFIKLMNDSYIILTDSGGIQEEAPSLGKPVLVMRDNTERPEALEAGTIRLVGSNQENIIKEVQLLLNDHEIYKKMATAKNPFGSGKASKNISEILKVNL